jgi:tetratricopeptide (TPR) repeat protein
VKELGEIVTVTMWGKWRRKIQVTAALLLFGFTSRIAGQQNPTFRRTRAPQGSNLLAEAQSALAHGDPKKAIEILSGHVQAHPKDIPARLALGQAYVIAGQNEQAEAEFQTVLKDAPGDVTALASVGEIYLHQGELDRAEAMLGRAAKARGSAPRIRMQWAVVLARLHRYNEAQSALAGLTPPSEPEQRVGFHRLKASVASGLGNPSVAASEMEKALALQPQDEGLTMATAVAELQSDNWRRAASLAEPPYTRTRDPQAGLVLLEAQLGMHGDFHKTLELLNASQLKPAEELAFRQRLAELLISHGEFSASIEELTRAAELDPNRGDLAYNRALAQFKSGRLDDALASAEKCRALGDTAELEDLLGDIQETRGENLAAVRSYQAAVALAPNEEKYRLSLAVEFVRHKSFDAARVVLKQAEEFWPKSWRIQLALGMVEYFAGSDEEASRILVHAAELAPEPETALRYLGNIQMDQASAPSPAAIAQLCGYSDRHRKDGRLQYYCGALLFRRDYVSRDKTHADEILRRLHIAANLLAQDAAPHCQIGKVYRWVERWQEAREESETCVRLDPDSAEGHYRLSQIYQHLGEAERSQQEMTLYKAASQRLADENARRDETMKTFLYTIQKDKPDFK